MEMAVEPGSLYWPSVPVHALPTAGFAKRRVAPPEYSSGGWTAPAPLRAPLITTHAVLRHNPAAAERCQEIHEKFEEVLDVAAAIEQPQRELDGLRESFRKDFGTTAPNSFADAPWSTGNCRTPEDALAANGAQRAAIVRRIAQLKQSMYRQLAVLEAEGTWLCQREAEISACAALPPMRLNDLPTLLLRRAMGLDGIFDPATGSLLHHTSLCAQVCSEWRQLVLHDPAYGDGLPADTRSIVLSEIATQLLAAQRTRHLCLDHLGWKWEDGGTDSHWRIVAAALRAMPVPLGICTMKLACSGLTADVAPQLSCARFLHLIVRTYTYVLWPTDVVVAEPFGRSALARELSGGYGSVEFLDLGGNSSLGDEGLRVLVPALSAGLIRLTVNDCSIGDAGMIALAAVLPSKKCLRTLDIGYSPGVTWKGWAALGDAVGRMPYLKEL